MAYQEGPSLTMSMILFLIIAVVLIIFATSTGQAAGQSGGGGCDIFCATKATITVSTPFNTICGC
ncbi:MAG: hypothetical protein HY366_00915 [Candidatus Aenigmarchaeota archaeon]|nr:hypothetical protein [Candidatus Aenigmarchaeota archaeon]